VRNLGGDSFHCLDDNMYWNIGNVDYNDDENYSLKNNNPD
jgi:hypothetical protein